MNDHVPPSPEGQEIPPTPPSTPLHNVRDAHDIGIPNLTVRSRKRLPSVVWMVPVIAALIGLWLVIHSITSQGPVITITFKSAEGLEVGKTKLRYKDVDVGQVKAITRSTDRKNVLVTAQLIKSAADILASDTRFFVVRPRISGGSVSGLSTLLSGAYISVDVGVATDSTDQFTGLESPPLVTRDSVGHEFVLHGKQIGSINYGSPVYFRHINAGHVTQYSLDKDGQGITLRVFIDAPYDQYVNTQSRFWHASGVEMSLDANGVKVATESLSALIDGGLAFQDTEDAIPGQKPADNGTAFPLFENREQAMRSPDTRVRSFLMYFKDSLRGLSKGAPVDLHGIVIGEVRSIGVDFSDNGNVPRFPVEISIYPDRLRAQLRSGNLLTGQLYVALDFFPESAPAKINWNGAYPVLPSNNGGLSEIQDTVGRITKKIDQVPFEKLSAQLLTALTTLNKTLESTEKLSSHLDTEVTPELTSTLKEARATLTSANAVLSEDAPVQQDLRDALKQVAKSARSLANLTDTLERHPDALVFGKEKVKP